MTKSNESIADYVHDGKIIIIFIIGSIIIISLLMLTGYPYTQKAEPDPYIEYLNEQLKDCTWIIVIDERLQQEFLAPKCNGVTLGWDAQTGQMIPSMAKEKLPE